MNIDDPVIVKTLVGSAITATFGIITYLYNYIITHFNRKKRLVYGLYSELSLNHEMLDSCLNYDKDIKEENIPCLNTAYYEDDFAKSNWTLFFNRIHPLQIPDNIKNEDLIKRFEKLKDRPFVSSIHSLYARIKVLNYACIASIQEGRTFNKGFHYKKRVNNIHYDLFILIYNLEAAFKYKGPRFL